MLIRPLAPVTAFIDQLNESLNAISPNAQLSRLQRYWLTLVLTGIVVTNTLNWALFERRGLGQFTQGQLRWMFSQAKLGWSHWLQASVRCIIRHYGITSGTLVGDDSDKQRSKLTSKIAWAHKVKDKKTGGYFNGQEMVFLLFVSGTVTFPVDVRFYAPDPALAAWRKRVAEQKKQGIERKQRDKKPAPSQHYPTKQQLLLEMVSAFCAAFPDVTIKGVLADALYGTSPFMDGAANATRGAQIVSQLRANQLVMSHGKAVSLKDYFGRQSAVTTTLTVRGHSEKTVEMLSARLHVKAHGKKRFVIALRYQGEKEFRYLSATDMSWRGIDIAQLYTLRWLIEVFIQDWKAHGGWHRLAKQQGDNGSTRGVILSLLRDHLLVLHPQQSALLKNRQPGLSAGCIVERIKTDALIDAIASVAMADDPVAELEKMTQALRDALPQRQSTKHMSGLYLGCQEPAPSLKYHRAVRENQPCTKKAA